ncbi:MAG: hypothetical protein K2F59_01510, partial [Eubacteriales bacterium]|nr:hypothetical protein [Eubacteriales bacterium]
MQSKDYWSKRALELEEKLFLESPEVTKKVKKSYLRVRQNIKKELEKTGAIFQTTSDTEVIAYLIA